MNDQDSVTKITMVVLTGFSIGWMVGLCFYAISNIID